MHGTGANGKSTLTRVFQDLLGEYAIQTPTQTLMRQPSGAIPNDLARIRGIRFVVATESGKSQELDCERLELMTAEDFVAARFMRSEWFQFKPTFKLFLTANRTCNLEVGALRTCLTWCVRAGYIAANPLSALERLPQTEDTVRKRRRALTDAEIGRFLRAAVNEDRYRKARFAAEKTVQGRTKGREWSERRRLRPIPQVTMWKLVIERGSRWNEVATLRWCDFDEEASRIFIRADQAKGRRGRFVPIPRSLSREIVSLRSLHAVWTSRVPSLDDNVLLSPKADPWSKAGARSNARRMPYRLLDQAGIDRFDATARSIDIHALRGTAATRLLRLGVPRVTSSESSVGAMPRCCTCTTPTYESTTSRRRFVMCPRSASKSRPRTKMRQERR